MNIINKNLPIERGISEKTYSKSSFYSCLILMGIIVGVRLLFEPLGYYFMIFQLLNNGFISLATIAIIYYPLNKKILKKMKSSYMVSDFSIYKKQFSNIYFRFLICLFTVAFVFLSFDILNIPFEKIDYFYLGLFWAFGMIIIDVAILFLINFTLPNQKKLPKKFFKPVIYFSALIAIGIWFIQLLIFEIYLRRLFGILLFEQDIRILSAIVSFVFFLSFYLLMNLKFLPKAKNTQLKTAETTKFNSTEESGSKSSVVLDVSDIVTKFYTEEGVVHAVNGVSFQVYQGEILGLVGETGCGKSVTVLSLIQLVRPPGKIESGKVIFNGVNLLKKSKSEMNDYRGKDIAMIFQDPLKSLNPVFKIGNQIAEVFLLHLYDELFLEAFNDPDLSVYSLAKQRSIDILRELNIPTPETIYDRYPHELSGGMRQRVQIAMALACRPKLLIADEPTTALDVTIQNQILKLMKDLQQKYNTSILFITHNLGIISKICDRVAVMYSGQIVEYGNKEALFAHPSHPYTQGLIDSIPVVGKKREELEVIPGIVPNLIYPPSGCKFHPRCKDRFAPCDNIVPKFIEIDSNYYVACHLYDPLYKDQIE